MSGRRSPGEGRYAQVEREQRWVLGSLPDGLVDPTEIEDRYLIGTRLRLRRMANDSVGVVYKLGQKVRPDPSSPAVVKLTNIYLSEPEYRRLSRLPAHELRKTRRRCPAGSHRARPVVVDEFRSRLTGLVLAELDLGPDEPALDRLEFPAVEVTADDRFSGGALAAASAEQARELLGAVAGLWSSPPRRG